MFEGYVVYYLNKYLGRYIQNINAEDLKLHLLSGNVVLRDLRMRPEALAALELPATVTAGLLGTLKLKIPWRSLGKDPVVVELDRLYIIAKPSEMSVGREGLTPEELEAEDEKDRAARIRRAEEAFMADLQKRIDQGLKEKAGGRFGPLIQTVLANLQVRVTRVHVRFEDDHTSPADEVSWGLTCERLSAQTVDEHGREAFVAASAGSKSDPATRLRKAMTLEKLSFYCNVGGADFFGGDSAWWGARTMEEWDGRFLPGILAAPTPLTDAVAPGSINHVLAPLNGRLVYTRRNASAGGAAGGAGGGPGSLQRMPSLPDVQPQDPFKEAHDGDPAQGASLQLDALAVRLPDNVWRYVSAFTDEISLYRRRLPHHRLRPTLRPLSQPGAARTWWRYAITAILRQVKKRRSVSWSEISACCRLRRHYVPRYTDMLLQGGGLQPPGPKTKSSVVVVKDELIESYDTQLPERTIVLFRKMAHVRAWKARKAAAATHGGADASEHGAGGAKRSILGRVLGWSGGTKKVGAVSFESALKNAPPVDPASVPPPEGPPPDLSAEEWEALESLVSSSAASDFAAGDPDSDGEGPSDDDRPSDAGSAAPPAKVDPTALLLRISIKARRISVELWEGGKPLTRLAITETSLRLLRFPTSTAGLASIGTIEAMTTGGPLLASAPPAAAPTVSATAPPPVQVLLLRFLHGARSEGDPDTSVEASLAPLYVTYDRQALSRIQKFFSRHPQDGAPGAGGAAQGQGLLDALGKKAADQAELLRRRAELKLQAALLERRRFQLLLDVAAPKIAIPLEGSPRSTAVVDLGRLDLRTNDEGLTDSHLSAEARALYSCFAVSFDRAALYFVDAGETGPGFSWALHETIMQQMALGGRESLALEGGATARALLQRLRAEVTALVARFPHPRHAKILLDLRIPSLDLSISPKRINRLMRFIRTLATPPPMDSTPRPALDTWLRDASMDAPGSVLRVPLLRPSGAVWEGRHLVLSDGSLHVLEHAKSVRSIQRFVLGGEGGWHARKVSRASLKTTEAALGGAGAAASAPPAAQQQPEGGAQTGGPEGDVAIVLVKPGTPNPVAAVTSRDATCFALADDEQTLRWFAEVLAAVRCASGPEAVGLDDDVALAGLESQSLSSMEGPSVHGAEGALGSIHAAEAGSRGPKPGEPGPGVVVRGELGRLRVTMRGYGPKPGWEKGTLGYHSDLYDKSDTGRDPLSEEDPGGARAAELDDASDTKLVTLTASDTALLYRMSNVPGEVSIDLALGTCNITDDLHGGAPLLAPAAGAGALHSAASAIQLQPTTEPSPDDTSLAAPGQYVVGSAAGGAGGASDATRHRVSDASSEEAYFDAGPLGSMGEEVMALLLGHPIKLRIQGSVGKPLAEASLMLRAPFHPRYQGTNSDLSLSLGVVDITVRRPTAAALAQTGLALVRAIPPPDPSHTPPVPPSQNTEIIGAHVHIHADGLYASFLYEGVPGGQPPRPFAVLEARHWWLDVSAGAKGVDLGSGLGTLDLHDGAIPLDHVYRHVISTRDTHAARAASAVRAAPSQSLLEVKVQYLHRAGPELSDRCPTGSPAVTVDVRLAALRILYLNRFLYEMLAYVRGFLEMRPEIPAPLVPKVLSPPPPSPSSTSAASAASSAPSASAPVPGFFSVVLDVDAAAPLLVMPRTTDAIEALELDLGKLQLSNRMGFLSLPGLPDAPAALIDDMNIALSQVKGSAVVLGYGSNPVLEQGAAIEIGVRRALRDVSGRLPGMDVRITVPSFTGRLTDAEYRFVSRVAWSNLNEEARVPLGAYLPAPRGVAAAAQPPSAAGPAPAPASAAAPAPVAGPLPRAAIPVRLRLSVGEVKASLDSSIPPETVSGPAEAAPLMAGSREPLAGLSLRDLSLEVSTKVQGGMTVDLCLPSLEVRDLRRSAGVGGGGGRLVLSSWGSGAAECVAAVDKTAAASPLVFSPPSLMVMKYDAEMHTGEGAGSGKRTLRLLLQQPTLSLETGLVVPLVRFFTGPAGSPAGSPGVILHPYCSLDLRLPAPKGDGEAAEVTVRRDIFLSACSRLLADGAGPSGDIVLNLSGHTLHLSPTWPTANITMPLILIGAGRTLRVVNGRIRNSRFLGLAVHLGPGSRLCAGSEEGITLEPFPIEPSADEGGEPSPLGSSLGGRSMLMATGSMRDRTLPEEDDTLEGPFGTYVVRRGEVYVPVRQPVNAPAAAAAAQAAAAAAASRPADQPGPSGQATGTSSQPVAAAPGGAAPAAVTFSTDIQVEAVGARLSVAGRGGDPGAGGPLRILEASMDASLHASFAPPPAAKSDTSAPRSDGPTTQFSAKARGLALDAVLLVQRAASAATGRPAEATVARRTPVLSPCDLLLMYRTSARSRDLHLSASDLGIRAFPELIDLLTGLQADLVGPVLQPSADQPIIPSRGYDFIDQLHVPIPPRPNGSAVPVQQPDWASHLTLWRPRPPPGYAILGHSASAGGVPPSVPAPCIAWNSGLVAAPTGYIRVFPAPSQEEIRAGGGAPALYDAPAGAGVRGGRGEGLHIWYPVAPAGHVALGCVVTEGPELPPPSAVCCPHRAICVPSVLGETLRGAPARIVEGGGKRAADADFWVDLATVGGPGGSFLAVPLSSVPDWRPARLADFALRLRSPIGPTPRQLCAALPEIARRVAAASRGNSGARVAGLMPDLLSDSAPWWGLQAAEFAHLASLSLGRTGPEAEEAQKAAANAGPVGSSVFTTTADLRRIWWSRDPTSSKPPGPGDSSPPLQDFAPGAAPKTGLSIWRPVAPAGFRILGHSLVSGVLPPMEALCVAEEAAIARPPVTFEMLWRIPTKESGRALTFWRPVPPEGYVAMGVITSLGQDKPALDTVRTLRADTVRETELPRPLWTVNSSYDDRPVELSAYIVDESTGLFTIDGARPGTRAVSYSVVPAWTSGQTPPASSPDRRQPGQRSRAPSPTPSGELSSNIIIEVGRTSVIVCGVKDRPIMELALGEVRAGVHSQEPGAFSTVATVQLEAHTFNSRLQLWEPLLEPWDCHLGLELGKDMLAGSKSVAVKVSSISEKLSLVVAHAALDSLVEAYSEWRQGPPALMDGLESSSSSYARVVVRNLLGTDLHMKMDFGRNMGQVTLPNGSAPLVSIPLKEPPERIRNKGTDEVADLGHVVPRVAVAVKIGSVRLVGQGGAAAQRGGGEGPEVEPDSDLFVSVGLEEARVKKDGGACRTGGRKLVGHEAAGSTLLLFDETLLVPLPPALVEVVALSGRDGGLGVAGRARGAQDKSDLQGLEALSRQALSVTATLMSDSDASAGPRVLETAILAIPRSALYAALRRLLDGETGSDPETWVPLPLMSESAPLGQLGALTASAVLVVYQTGARIQRFAKKAPARGHSRGERAIGTYASGPWAIVPSGGVPRPPVALWALEPVLRAALPPGEPFIPPPLPVPGVGHVHGVSLGAVVLPGREGVAVIESCLTAPYGSVSAAAAASAKGAAVPVTQREEHIRTPYQIANATAVPHRVALVLRDRASVQDVAMAAGAGVTVRPDEDFLLIAEEEVFENQRFQPLRGWSSAALMRIERGRFSDRFGNKSSDSFPEVSLPPGWLWEADWALDTNHLGCMDKDGFQYAVEWSRLDWPPRQGDGPAAMSCVRRRRWVRRRRREHRGTPAATSASAASASSSPGATDDPVIKAVTADRSARFRDLGVVPPGGRLPFPLDCVPGDLDVSLHVRPEPLSGQAFGGTGGAADARFGWSALCVPASSVIAGFSLMELRDGTAALLRCSPRNGFSGAQEDSAFWTSVLVEGRPLAVHARHGLDVITDWQLTLLPPLILEAPGPIPCRALVASEAGMGVFEGKLEPGLPKPIHDIDPTMPLVMRFEPEGLAYDDRGPVRVNPTAVLARRGEPTFLSCTLRAGQGQQQNRIMLTGFVAASALVNNTNAAPTKADARGGPRAPAAVHSPVRLRFFVPVNIENRSDAALSAVIISLGAAPKPDEGLIPGSQLADLLDFSAPRKDSERERSTGGTASISSPGSFSRHANASLVSDPRAPVRGSPLCFAWVAGGCMGLASYPLLQANEMFGVQLRCGESGWCEPLPLVAAATSGRNGSKGGAGDADGGDGVGASTSLIRFVDPSLGVTRDLLVSIDLGAQDQFGSADLPLARVRVEPLFLVSNRTALPLFLRDAPGALITVKPLEIARPLYMSAAGSEFSRRLAISLEPVEGSGNGRAGARGGADAGGLDLEALGSGRAGTDEVEIGVEVSGPLAEAAGVQLPPGSGPTGLGSSVVVPVRARVELLVSGSVHLAVVAIGGAFSHAVANLSSATLQVRSPGQGWAPLPALSAKPLVWVSDSLGPRQVEVQDGTSASLRPRAYSLEGPMIGASAGRSRASRVLGGLPGSLGLACVAPGKQCSRLPSTFYPGHLHAESGTDWGFSRAAPRFSKGFGPWSSGTTFLRVQQIPEPAPLLGVAAASSAARPGSKALPGERVGPGANDEEDALRSRLLLTLALPAVEISVVDAMPREILLIAVDNLHAEVGSGLGHQDAWSVRLNVRNLTVSDMRPFAVFPVAIALDPTTDPAMRGDPCFSLCCTLSPPKPPILAVPTLFAQGLGRLIIAVDESLMWLMLDFVRQLDLQRLSGAAAGAQPSSGAAAERAEPLLDLGLLHLTLPTLRFSFSANEANRPRTLRSNFFMGLGLAFASIENVRIPRVTMDREEQAFRPSVLRRTFSDLVVQNVIRVFPSLIFNASWSRGIGKAIDTIEQGVGSALSKLPGMEDEDLFMRDASANDPSRSGLMDGMLGGAQSVGRGVFKGLTGLVTKPMEGAKKEGASGFFKGLAKGAVGAAINPVSGVVQGLARTAEGAVSEVTNRTKQIAGAAEISRQLLGGSDSVGYELTRPRKARCIGANHAIRPFNTSDSAGQELMWAALRSRVDTSDPVAADSACEGDRFEFARRLDQGNLVVIATSARVMLVEAASSAGPFLGPGATPVHVKWEVSWATLLALELEFTRQAYDSRFPPDVLVLHLKGIPAKTDAVGGKAMSRSGSLSFGSSSALGGAPEPVFRREIRCKTGGDLAVQLKAIIRATYRTRLPPERGGAFSRLLAAEAAPGVSLLQAPGAGAAGGAAALSTTPSMSGMATPVDEESSETSSVSDISLVSLATHVPCTKYTLVYGGRREEGPRAITIWRPVGPPGYFPVGDVIKVGLEEPDLPVLVFREKDAGPEIGAASGSADLTAEGEAGESLKRSGGTSSGPPLVPPVGYTLIWRDGGKPALKAALPVSIWLPEAPVGYLAVGCVASAELLEPPLDAVRCVRRDLMRTATYKNRPTWETAAQDLLGWSVAFWEVVNAAGTFMAVRNPRPAAPGAAPSPPQREPLEPLLRAAGPVGMTMSSLNSISD